MTMINIEFDEVHVDVEMGEATPVNIIFDGVVGVVAHGETHAPGASDDAFVFSWIGLLSMWSVEPSVIATIAAGDVYQFIDGGVTRYKLDPQPYDPLLDTFYATFNDPVLSDPIATRGRA